MSALFSCPMGRQRRPLRPRDAAALKMLENGDGAQARHPLVLVASRRPVAATPSEVRAGEQSLGDQRDDVVDGNVSEGIHSPDPKSGTSHEQDR